MRILIEDYGFHLPMASAILTVLYPSEFSIYDVRVCDQLRRFYNAQNFIDFEKLWIEYGEYIHAVQEEVRENYSLRDKDRWLWGKSFKEQLCCDIRAEFVKERKDSRDSS